MSYHNPHRKSTNNTISHVAIATRMLIAKPQYQGRTELMNCLKSFHVSTFSLLASLRISCRSFKCSRRSDMPDWEPECMRPETLTILERFPNEEDENYVQP